MTGGSLRYLIKQGFSSIRANKMMSVASIFVLLCSMLLVGAAIIFSVNITSILDFMEGQNEIRIYLDVDIDEVTKNNVNHDLEQMDDIEHITLFTKEEALEQMIENSKKGGTEGEDTDIAITSAYEDLRGDENPFPDVYIITLKDLTKSEDIVKTISNFAGVTHITEPKSLTAFLVSLRNGITTGGLIIVSLLVVVSLVLTGNTIRLTVFNRRKEINIMKFVGATDAFIRLPFVVEGIALGLIAAALAFGATAGYYIQFYNMYSASTTEILGMFTKNLVPFTSFAWQLCAGFFAGGIITGGFGSFLFVRKHLRV